MMTRWWYGCDRAAAMLVIVLLLVSCGGGDDSDPPVMPNDSGTLPAGSFTADRQTIAEGEFTTLQWNIANGSDVSITPDIGSVGLAGSERVSPTESTEYRLSAIVGGEQLASVLVINVRPLAAVQIVASARAGVAPLTVRLTPVPDSLTAINRYYWDFEGDGGDVDGGLGAGAEGFDRLSFGAGSYDVAGRDVLHTFDDPGTYRPRVRVWDEVGNQAEAMVEIVVGNAAPSAYLRASPTSGRAPLKVSFNVASSDNEGIESYEWDFDGDGVYDSVTTSTRESYTYETSGSFQVGIRVTDKAGESIVLTPIHMQVAAVDEVIPSIIMSARPTQGKAPLEVEFRSQTNDLTRSGIVGWEWDFDGDGTVDSREERIVTHTFDRVGNFYPRVKLITADGSSSTDILNIVTEADHSLVISNAAIDPEQGGVAKLEVSLKGSSRAELVMESNSGERVRTLWPDVERNTGEYTLSWDGKSDQGRVQPPGDYYAVLRYTDSDDVERVLDYRVSTGGSIFYPSDWGGSCRGTDRGVDCGVLTVSDNEIEPFNGQPLVYQFSNPHIARMTAYVTVIGTTDFAPATFYRSQLLGPGDYEVKWHGEGTNGKFLPRLTSGGYLPAIYGLTASDNAVMLTHQTTVDNLAASPPIVYPGSFAGRNESSLSFDLNRVADVVLTIDNTDSGVEVLRRTYEDVAAGTDISIIWDGRGNSNEWVAPGAYRLSVYAKDQYGQSSLPVRTMQRVQY